MDEQERSLYRYEFVRKAPDGVRNTYQFTFDGNPISLLFVSSESDKDVVFNEELNRWMNFEFKVSSNINQKENKMIEGPGSACEKMMTLTDVTELMCKLLHEAKEVEENSEQTKNKFFQVGSNEKVTGEKEPSPHRNKVQELEFLINRIGMVITRTNNNIGDIRQLIGD